MSYQKRGEQVLEQTRVNEGPRTNADGIAWAKEENCFHFSFLTNQLYINVFISGRWQIC